MSGVAIIDDNRTLHKVGRQCCTCETGAADTYTQRLARGCQARLWGVQQKYGLKATLVGQTTKLEGEEMLVSFITPQI